MPLGYFRTISKELFQVDNQKGGAVQHSVGIIVPLATGTLLSSCTVMKLHISSGLDAFHNIIHLLEPQITHVYSFYNLICH